MNRPTTRLRYRQSLLPDLRFVVQEHHAALLRYDLRLEFDGVLKSWALPKGPSMAAEERRLAVQLPDQPLDYLGVEGRVKATAMVYIWDEGVYAPARYGDLATDLERGSLTIVLAGTQLRGRFSLQRVASDSTLWLLTKARDRFACSGWELRPHEPDAPSWLSSMAEAALLAH